MIKMPSVKVKTSFVCSDCGFETPRWYGKCPSCGHWNTLEEVSVRESKAAQAPAVLSGVRAEKLVSCLADVDYDAESRRNTGLTELDRVLGGGIVDGSVILLSGDPGIGKSTLLLQVCGTVCETRTVLYVAGEESPRQIKLRAGRLGVKGENLYTAAVTELESVLGAIEHVKPDIVMVDSIQTMNCADISSSSGSVTQVRECAQRLMRVAKENGVPVFLVGHVNKDGGIAGPKVLEHMVDVVLYFEGERQTSSRILRAVKNRFGSTNEIGVFEMSENGLTDVENPSLMLLSGRPEGVSGTCVACVMEGTRPILAEVQALVSKTGFGVPRRMSTGFDYNRAALLIAVLEKRCGYFFGNMDTYVNIIGGLKLDEPAADLPVALSLVSNLLDRPCADNVAAFGEIGLAGEIRAVTNIQTRVNECARLGFTRLVLPKSSMKNLSAPAGVELIPAANLTQALAVLGK
jgi:DNA repair protein RadA/Sms